MGNTLLQQFHGSSCPQSPSLPSLLGNGGPAKVPETVGDFEEYGSFGNIADPSSLFTGLEHDAESGAVFTPIRTFVTSPGQWMEEEPIRCEAGDLNARRYVE